MRIVRLKPSSKRENAENPQEKGTKKIKEGTRRSSVCKHCRDRLKDARRDAKHHLLEADGDDCEDSSAWHSTARVLLKVGK